MEKRTPQVTPIMLNVLIGLGMTSEFVGDIPTQDEVVRWMRVEYDIDIDIERCEFNGRNPPLYNGTVDYSHDATHFNSPLEYDAMQLKCIEEGMVFVKAITKFNAMHVEKRDYEQS